MHSPFPALVAIELAYGLGRARALLGAYVESGVEDALPTALLVPLLFRRSPARSACAGYARYVSFNEAVGLAREARTGDVLGVRLWGTSATIYLPRACARGWRIPSGNGSKRDATLCCSSLRCKARQWTSTPTAFSPCISGSPALHATLSEGRGGRARRGDGEA